MLQKLLLTMLCALCIVSAAYADTYSPFVSYDAERDKAQTVPEVLEKILPTANWGPMLREMAMLSGLDEKEVERRLREGEYLLVTDCTVANKCKFHGGGISAARRVGYFYRNPHEGETFGCINNACISSMCANPGTLTNKPDAVVEKKMIESGCVSSAPVESTGYVQTPGFYVKGFSTTPSTTSWTQQSSTPTCTFAGKGDSK